MRKFPEMLSFDVITKNNCWYLQSVIHLLLILGLYQAFQQFPGTDLLGDGYGLLSEERDT